MALIYKIVTEAVWQAATAQGTLIGMPVDLQDGYIHFSAADQVRETARKHFSGQSNLVLLAVEAGRLGDRLRWEVSRGGALFPHLYAPLAVADVSTALPLAVDAAGNPIIPQEIA
ncbi:MAG: DUF952 domain-containing protein [Proteobacteria bacterium]|nr:DUF952 domain-containing protein [Pseudomonadota bacterium]